MSWENETRRILRAELVRRDVTYGRLATRLGAIGISETERSIANKLSRGTFSFAFFLQCMKALGAQTVTFDIEMKVPPISSESNDTPSAKKKVAPKSSESSDASSAETQVAPAGSESGEAPGVEAKVAPASSENSSPSDAVETKAPPASPESSDPPDAVEMKAPPANPESSEPPGVG